MASVSRRSTMALAIGCGVLLASQALLVSVPMSASTAGSSCVELKRWAESYKGTAPTLEQLAHYDRAHRVAIFNAVSPQVRATLWQEQLRRFDQRTDLTVTQHQLVAEARAIVTPALYAHEPVVNQAYNDLTPRIKATFASREHRLYLTNVAFTGTRPQPQTPTLLGKLMNPFVANAAAEGSCECSTANGPAECWSGVCVGVSCFETLGCGPFGNWTCNGMCS